MTHNEIVMIYIRYSRIANDMLRPQDVLVLLKLTTLWPQTWTYASLATSLGMSASEVHAAIRRTTQAGLFSESARTAIQPELGAFLIDGVPYVFYAEQGGMTKRGLLTGFAAPVLDGPDSGPPSDLNVWPDASGIDSGRIIKPLYRSVPYAARQDPMLYRLLCLVDELRIGRARERNRATEMIREALC
ncbi:MAG: hypothetical protein Rubg2KO_29680 [Rubricoccaceae bacterium]